MTNKNKPIDVRQLLKTTYAILTKRNKPQEIILPDRTLAEIANDSDIHRTKVGYMQYKSAGLFKFNGITFAIARGQACGDCPAEPYDSDLLALELSVDGKTRKQIQEELVERIEIESSYFMNSISIGMADGNLAFTKNEKFGETILDKLQPELPKFIAQEAEYNTSCALASTLRHPITKVMLYKPEFADILADSIEAVLNEYAKCSKCQSK